MGMPATEVTGSSDSAEHVKDRIESRVSDRAVEVAGVNLAINCAFGTFYQPVEAVIEILQRCKDSDPSLSPLHRSTAPSSHQAMYQYRNRLWP